MSLEKGDAVPRPHSRERQLSSPALSPWAITRTNIMVTVRKQEAPEGVCKGHLDPCCCAQGTHIALPTPSLSQLQSCSPFGQVSRHSSIVLWVSPQRLIPFPECYSWPHSQLMHPRLQKSQGNCRSSQREEGARGRRAADLSPPPVTLSFSWCGSSGAPPAGILNLPQSHMLIYLKPCPRLG